MNSIYNGMDKQQKITTTLKGLYSMTTHTKETHSTSTV